MATSGKTSVLSTARAVWDFTRPHTIIGSCISIISLYLFAVPQSMWQTQKFLSSLIAALVPSLFMNLFITGLNQVTDVEIDKINKPYLPLASGALSFGSGVGLVLASLALSLFNVKSMAWPLQYTLVGSALLGTLYSLPPFRLKRFPLLAAMCILVVRGSLINLGFYLNAKSSVLGQSLPAPALSLASLAQFANQAWKTFPEAVAATVFFAVFGVVIALMKDVPDVRGDTQYSIPSFSVKLGAARMFRVAWTLLYALLVTGATGVLVSSTALHPVLQPVLRGAATILPRWDLWWAAKFPSAVATTVPALTRNVRLAVAAALAWMARDVRQRARLVEAEQPDQVFAYYMHVWNIFYACYMLLPALRG